MVIREHYLQQLRPFYDSDLVKIVTGIRRCGKSVLLQQVRDELQLRSGNVIYLEFENRRVRSAIPGVDALLNYVAQHRKPGLCHVLLDEVQELEQWHEACQTLRLEQCSVFVTGSNSKLLSHEFTQALSGRYVAFQVRPFVYKELLQHGKELGRDVSILDYLVWGGLPQRLNFEGEALQRYLEDLDETIIYKDIIVRYKLRKVTLFRAIADFLLRSNGRLLSVTSIRKALRKQHPCTALTIRKYIDFLENAYAISCLQQYSAKTKQVLDAHPKLYDGDVALNSLRCPDNRYDLDHNLENIVFHELLFMGYELHVYPHHGREIDFLAQKGNQRYYVQVAYSVQDDKAFQRECKAFESLGDPLSQRVLITTDELDYSTSTVRHIPLSRFLLLDEL